MINIGIAGLIASGKTTLAEKLAKELKLNVNYEPVEDNPILALFYDNKERYSFLLQIYFMTKRMKLYERNGIFDRTIYEDLCFVEILRGDNKLTNLEYNTYVEHFNVIKKFINNNELIIYLDVKPEIALQRIKSRGREYEQNITLDYLEKLKISYEKHIFTFGIPVIKINWDEFRDTDYVINEIKRYF